METYKIETNEKEMQCMIAALRIYKSELFDAMLSAIRNEKDERYNSLYERSKETKELLHKLQLINDPPF